MVKRYKKKESAKVIPEGVDRLPTDRRIAVYYRQSTDAQVGNISTSIQTVDMVEYLKNRGWIEDNIIMIDMDAGISGSKKISERPGMSRLFELVNDGKIGAVACQDEDRLFRDVTQIQVNIFIEACRQSKVLVITPSMVYDFANELTGVFHARQFRFKSEMAAEYINAVIRGKLHRAKRRLLMEGRWAGAGMPPGFMVDMRRTLSDGSKNPEWKRYVKFEPYAEIVNAYFRMFLARAGNVRAVTREIHKHGPYYPDPKTCTTPKGFKVFYRLHRYGHGYCPGRTGLISLLTNAAYLGHWAVNDVIVKWDNHPAIVNHDIFMQAYNYLCNVTLNGKPNPYYIPVQEHARPSRDEKRPVERPICVGMIVSKDGDQWRNVGTNWVGKHKHYSYVLWAAHPMDKYVWGKKADYVDDAISALVRYKLRATFDKSIWDKSMELFVKNYGKTQRLKKSRAPSLSA